MAFDDVIFPTVISRGVAGGPERRTDVVMTASGREERNSRWAHSRRRYNAGVGVKSVADLHAVIDFFEARRGRLHAFRFKDHADFKAADQVIGMGDGVTASFQLIKTYGAPSRLYVRKISAPMAGTVLVAVNGVPTTAFTLNAMTGVVTFNSAPAAGAAITASFEFDVPVRFDVDSITVNLSHFEAGDIPEIPLVEVRP
jgi:uncharacterized protein (TIGR02217 family)